MGFWHGIMPCSAEAAVEASCQSAAFQPCSRAKVAWPHLESCQKPVDQTPGQTRAVRRRAASSSPAPSLGPQTTQPTSGRLACELKLKCEVVLSEAAVCSHNMQYVVFSSRLAFPRWIVRVAFPRHSNCDYGSCLWHEANNPYSTFFVAVRYRNIELLDFDDWVPPGASIRQRVCGPAMELQVLPEVLLVSASRAAF